MFDIKKRVIAVGLKALGWTKLKAGEDGKVLLTEKDRAKLNKLLPDEEEKLAALFEKYANEELQAQSNLSEAEKGLEALKSEMNAILEENGISSLDDLDNLSEEGDEPETEDAPPATGYPKSAADVNALRKQAQALQRQIKAQKKQIRELSEELEVDAPQAIRKTEGTVTHSATHLFASSNGWDQFKDRPWNERAKQASLGHDVKSESYSELDIQRIIDDFNEYHTDSNRVISFIRELYRLPKHWGRVSGVQHEQWYAKLFVGDITQGRKKKWLPKGKFEFQPEKARVYDTQIDLHFSGADLQRIEKNWLGRFNKEGASPFKMSFVEMLLMELLKKQREEDQLVLINGVFHPTADDATEAGHFMHRLPGIKKLAYDAAQARKYLPFKNFKTGSKPTATNIYDYVEEFVKRMDKYWRDYPGMVLHIDTELERAYHKVREALKGTNVDYQPGKMTVDFYENIRLEPVYNLGDFMFCTPDDNIDILEGNPGEQNRLTMQKEKRDLIVFGDYRLGLHVYVFGYEWPEGVEMNGSKQMFFSNTPEGPENTWVPTLPNATTLDAKYHNRIQTGVNTGATAITAISNVPAGTYVTVYGNTGTASTIASGANFDLAASIAMVENTWIKLYKRPSDNKLVEVGRGDLSTSDISILDPDATVCDASGGFVEFLTSANTGATAITDIVGAETGVIYHIEGGSATNATTIAASGKFSRISAGITLTTGNYLEVEWNGEKFVEVNRYVA